MNKFREELANKFIDSLNESPIEFIQSWKCSHAQINFTNDMPYKGINQLHLSMIANERGYKENRWMTFLQIKEKGFHLEQGSKGTKVEYYFPYDLEEHKSLTWQEYRNRAKKDDFDKNRYSLKQKLYTVFNGDNIVGMPEQIIEEIDIKEDEIIKRVSEGMNVKIEEKPNFDKACYSPILDIIQIPIRGQFLSQDDYTATVLHELGHATGGSNRLNRNQMNFFGSPEYAYEELVAEMISAFMGEYTGSHANENIAQNHIAYYQAWGSMLKDNKELLFKAVKDANLGAEYMIEKGRLVEYLDELKGKYELEKDNSEKKSKEKEEIVKRDEEFEF